MCHMITCESLILESGKLSFIGIFSKLSEREIEKIIFGSDLRIFKCDPLISEIFEKCSIDYILTNEEKIGKILGIEVLSHEKLYEDIFIESTGYLMAKYSDNLTRSDLCKCNVYFIILFILYEDIDIALYYVSHFLPFIKALQGFESFFDFLRLFEFEYFRFIPHISFEPLEEPETFS